MMKESIRAIVVACHLIIIIGLVTACSADGSRMRRQLHALQAHNQADSLMTDDSLALALCIWFDSHGTPNERMLAHYLMGRTWADKGEAPQALEEYHRAAECADTTTADCDYHILTRIHAQTANLFYEQLMPNEMLGELKRMYASAQSANDTLSKICSVEWQSIAYDLLGETDSVSAVLLEAYAEYSDCGYKDMAVNCLPVLIDLLVNKGDYEQAKIYIDIYENNANWLRNDKISGDQGIYYYYLGNYYVGVNSLDSAEYYYRTALASLGNNTREAALKGLYELFKRRNMTDSVAKYADLCYKTSVERFTESNAEKLRHMHSLYDYSRNQSVAAQMTIKADRNQHRLNVVIIVAVFAVAAFIFFIVSARRKKEKELALLREQFQREIEQQICVKNEILQLQKKEYEALLQQKEDEVAKHQEAIEAIRLAINPQSSIEQQIADTDIYKRFEYLALNFNKRVYADDWKNLGAMIDDMLPHFRPTLYAQYHIDEKDYRLCMLIRLHFSLSQIGILLGENSQYLSKRRKALLSKLFHQQGKPDSFDKIIKSIS